MSDATSFRLTHHLISTIGSLASSPEPSPPWGQGEPGTIVSMHQSAPQTPLPRPAIQVHRIWSSIIPCQSDLDSRVIPGSDVLTFDSVRLQVPLCSIPPDAKGAEYASGNLFPPRTEVSVKSKYNSTTNSSTHSVVWGRELSPPTTMLSEKEAPRVRDVSLPLISIPSQETRSGEFAASSREET
jgi:hypothetical protein